MVEGHGRECEAGTNLSVKNDAAIDGQDRQVIPECNCPSQPGMIYGAERPRQTFALAEANNRPSSWKLHNTQPWHDIRGNSHVV